MNKLLIRISPPPPLVYPVYVGPMALKRLGAYLKPYPAARRIVCVTSPNVASLHWETLKNCFPRSREICPILVSDRERDKNLKTVKKIISALIELKVNRYDLLIAFGGGVIGDMTALAASLYLRGIDFISIPTTLLSQIDSSVGGKCGINLSAGKNLVGAFHHPKAVFCDVRFLKTLPQKEWRSGLAEVIKYAVLEGGGLWFLLRRHKRAILNQDPHLLRKIILACLNIKKTLIESDEKDHRQRRLLNLGHTIGHALEASQRYQKLSHGEAVAQGLYYVAELSYRKNFCSKRTRQKIFDLLSLYDFYPLRFSRNVFAFLHRDKKRKDDKLHWIMIRKIGQVCQAPALFQ